MNRSFEIIDRADLERLRRIAISDQDDLFRRRPATGALYAGNRFAIALCQGAALHFLDGKNGVKDFDVWCFYYAASRPFPYRRRGIADFGDSKFGVTDDFENFKGRRVDVIGRSLNVSRTSDPTDALQTYFSLGATTSAKYLARKAVVILDPLKHLGSVIWPIP